MNKRSWFAAAALVALLCMPALAGSMGKCGNDTQTCLNGFAAMKETMGWSGLRYDKNDSGQLVIKEVIANSPAAAAGITAGDVLTTVNGVKFNDETGMKKVQANWKAGAQVSYTLLRDGAEKQVSLTLAKMPEDVFDAMVGAHMLMDHVTTAADAESKGVGAKNAEAAPVKK